MIVQFVVGFKLFLQFVPFPTNVPISDPNWTPSINVGNILAYFITHISFQSVNVRVQPHITPHKWYVVSTNTHINFSHAQILDTAYIYRTGPIIIR